MKQALLDRIRVFNKYVTNKVLIHISGKEFGHFVNPHFIKGLRSECLSCLVYSVLHPARNILSPIRQPSPWLQ